MNRVRAWLMLGLAVVCGLLAAFAVMQLLEERTTQLPTVWTVRDVRADGAGWLVVLDDGQRLRADTVAVPENARNIALLYPGKTVSLQSDGRGCTRLVPLLQADRPALPVERYRALSDAGLRDLDLAVSFSLPPIAGAGFEDPGPTASVCAQRAT